jgi:hypothetical protein
MTMHDVAADQAELALQVERRMDLPRDHRALEVGGVLLTVSMIRSAAASRSSSQSRPFGQHGRELLAEQAGDVHARRRQAVVDGGRQLHLDDRLRRPAVRLRVGEGLVHIVERRRDDDAAV